MSELHTKGGIEYARVAEDYLQKRQLKQGASGLAYELAQPPARPAAIGTTDAVSSV